jgi:hypothetical protein
MTRFRISAHKLYIETGIYLGILRHDRICTRCSINEVEDEQHYLFTCPGMESKRKILYDTIEKSCINFEHSFPLLFYFSLFCQSLTKKSFNLSPLIFELSPFNNELTLSKNNFIVSLCS